MTDSGQPGPDPVTPQGPPWNPAGGASVPGAQPDGSQVARPEDEQAEDDQTGAPAAPSTAALPWYEQPWDEAVGAGEGLPTGALPADPAAPGSAPDAPGAGPGDRGPGAASSGAVPVGSAGAGAPAAAAGIVGQGASAERQAPPGRARTSTRPRWLVPLVALVVVLVAAVVVVAVLVNRDGGDEPVPATSTVQLPSPTPTVEPVAREAGTPFADALPTSVLQYALASSAQNDAWLDAGAIEAYTETYTDGGSGSVEVLAGQLETADAAARLGQELVTAAGQDASGDPLPSAGPSGGPSSGAPGAGGGALLDSGEVLVRGTAAGSYAVVDRGDGTGVAAWWNGTAVFQVTGPVADIANLYAAYPL